MGTETTDALVDAAKASAQAPSVANTQPWHWQVRGETLELHTDPNRQLSTYDPMGRMMVVSCGCALHLARMALAAHGYEVDIDRAPAAPGMLASVTITGRTSITPEAVRRLETAAMRRTDRRPVGDEPVPAKALDEIRSAAEAERTWLHILRSDDVFELATAAGQAAAFEDFDPRWHTERQNWFGGERAEGTGVPSSALPQHQPETTVSNVNYGPNGELPVDMGHDRGATYAILYGGDETDHSWLRAGEALNAAWLVATELGVSVTPMSATVEVPGTRQVLRHLVSHLGEPYLVLRLGIPVAGIARVPKTPRLNPEAIVDVAS